MRVGRWGMERGYLERGGEGDGVGRGRLREGRDGVGRGETER